MNKYSSEFKLKVMKYCLEKFHSFMDTSKQFNVAKSCVKRWVKKYKIQGPSGLTKNLNSSYSGDFKVSVIKYMHNNYLSLSETAIHFNLVYDQVIAIWERIYYEEVPQALY